MTRKMRSLFAVVGVLIISKGILLQAGVIPGRWEKLDAQAPGTGLKVTLKAGDRIEAIFRGSDQNSLTLATSAGERQIAKMDVGRVETSQQVADPTSNGTLIGMGVGLFLGIVGIQGTRGGGEAASLVVFSTGLYALIGYVIDLKIRGPEVLYVAK